MELLLAPLIASPIAAMVASMAFALTLLSVLAAVSLVAGVYYSAPKMVVKWLTRRALYTA